ncbi:hypothetical protein [Demequina activiva]|uniref:Lipoprotein n=1 Tax=Demequina activiva TaxID=1582364 RepID=A0A919ULQ4_9MICO|nr:hypothetical protein [Demequina activiva]GIG54943.1 hypothetical protein Dac01nite_16950 [Demequina activiva]
MTWRQRATAAAIAIAVGASLSACTSDEPQDADLGPTTSTPTPEASATASATPAPVATASPSPTETEPAPRTTTEDGSASAAVPQEWSEDAATEGGLTQDPAVTGVIGAWSAGQGEVSVVTIRNDTGASDPEAYFAEYFGELGEDDGVTVSHESTTTDDGDPLLLIDIEPSAGQGGDAQTLSYVLGEATIVAGVLTYDGALSPAEREAFVALAVSTEVS